MSIMNEQKKSEMLITAGNITGNLLAYTKEEWIELYLEMANDNSLPYRGLLNCIVIARHGLATVSPEDVTRSLPLLGG